MNGSEVWVRVKSGISATARCIWRTVRLLATWIRRKTTISRIDRDVSAKVAGRNELLLQIGRVMCTRHLALPLQDEELTPLCQSASDLDSEIKGLRKKVVELQSSPLLPEDMGAQPLGTGRGELGAD
jgi:hypothetical protein